VSLRIGVVEACAPMHSSALMQKVDSGTGWSSPVCCDSVALVAMPKSSRAHCPRFFYVDARSLFDIVHDGGMVKIAFAFVHKGDQHLLH
jgi:hypothetical protein